MSESRKKQTSFIETLLTFITSFIKHFLIGIKFVFFDVFYNVIESLTTNKQTISQKKKDSEKVNLIEEMQKDILSREIKKDYYIYTGIDENSKKVSGRISARSKITLNNFLANEGIKVTEIKKDFIYNFLKKIGLDSEKELRTKDLIFWLTAISTYLKSGLTLNDTIKIMTKQAEKDLTKSKLYRSISYELTLGESFSTALENQGHVFPPLLINMIKSAEATGDLIKTLDDMANYYTEIDKTRKEMISAIIYPTILLVFALAVMTFIMVYVIPEFIKVYNQAGITVNGFTLAIINLSNYITANLSIISTIALIAIITILFLYKKSQSFRKFIQTIGMKIPFFGNIIIYHELTLFTKTFASLLKNNVYIVNSMEILTNITNNEVYKDIMVETISNIARGEKISLSFYNKWCVPDVAYYMIATGESTGELSLMMDKVASYYSDLHRSKVVNLKSFLEPIMIVILALIVGIIILAVVIPMFSLYEEIS